jgi:hypothetical protein
MTGLWPSLLRRFLRRPDVAMDTDAYRWAEDERARDYFRFRAEMSAGGYVEWASTPPTGQDVVQCRRMEWPRMEIIRPAHTSPWMNVSGLYWRDVGGVVDVESSAISCGNLRLP